MADAPDRDARTAAVEAYKTILRGILDQRPSGTRQRLASALGKNRSFVSHIANPAYPVPIPAPHLGIIFDVCHFSPAEKRAFLEAFGRAHPNRIRQDRPAAGPRSITLEAPDFGSAATNREYDDLMRDMARRLARLLQRKS